MSEFKDGGPATNKARNTRSPVDAKLDMADIDELRDRIPASDRVNKERFGFIDRRTGLNAASDTTQEKTSLWKMLLSELKRLKG